MTNPEVEGLVELGVVHRCPACRGAQDRGRYALCARCENRDVVARLAREFVRQRAGADAASDGQWFPNVRHYREMCAKYPDYADGYSLITDAFRDARIAVGFLTHPLPDGEGGEREKVIEECARVAESNDAFPQEGEHIAERIRSLTTSEPRT